MQLVGAACVFLACKSTESPRSLRDVAYVYLKVLWQNKPEKYERLKNETVRLEHIYL